MPSVLPHPCPTTLIFAVALAGIPLHRSPADSVGSSAPALGRPRPAICDYFTPADASSVRLNGLLGQYQDGIRERFLLYPDLVSKYLEPLEKHGDQFWKAEHIGKWLDTASGVWKYSGDSKIRTLMDDAVRRMAAAQNPNGWLGGYDEPHRFYQVNWNARPGPSAWDDERHGWDLWCNFMSMEGLVKYHSVVKDDTIALQAAQRIGDLIVQTFGEGRQDITLVPHDNGIGAMTSLLGLIQLYEWTGEPRYLEFCRYVVRQFGRPGTIPIILSGTRTPDAERFPFTSDGAVLKHAESELVLRGICDMYRMTGDPALLDTCRNVYTAGYAPLLQAMCLSGYNSPAQSIQTPRAVRLEVETCDIPPTLRWWIEMFQLTGDVQYLNAVERQVYNQLLCHRAPNGKAFEFMPATHFERPSGCSRPYSDLDPFNCCWSMGPVGLADLPAWAWFTAPDGLLVNFYEPSEYRGTVEGVPVEIQLKSDYPLDGEVEIALKTEKPASFGMHFRIPTWCHSATARVNGHSTADAPLAGTILAIKRVWRTGDRVKLDLPMPARATRPVECSPGCSVLERGPLVLAMSRRFNVVGDGWSYAAPATDRAGRIRLKRVALPEATGGQTPGWQAPGTCRVDNNGDVSIEKCSLTLVPFYSAGLGLDPYIAVFPLPETLGKLPPRLGKNKVSDIASLANGATALAESDAGGNAAGPQNIIDGKRDTAWTSSTNAGPHSVEIKLRRVSRVGRVILRFEDERNHPVDFRIQAGVGGGSFSDLLCVTNCKFSDYYWARVKPIETDRLRIVVEKSSRANAGARINEVEVFEN